MIPLRCIPESCSPPPGASQSTDSVNGRTTGRDNEYCPARFRRERVLTRLFRVPTYVAERLPPLRVTRNSGAACRHVTRHLWYGWEESDHASLAEEATYAVSQWQNATRSCFWCLWPQLRLPQRRSPGCASLRCVSLSHERGIFDGVASP